MSDKFTLKLNNGDTAVLHSASGDWVPVADLGLCTLWRANKAESERDAALDREMRLAARVAEVERAQDAAFRDAHRAEADAARLREALKKYGDHHPCCDYGDAVASIPCSCGFRTALASTPSAEPTPRDMRVAEAVRVQLLELWTEGLLLGEIRALDLAAVVAKAVGT